MANNTQLTDPMGFDTSRIVFSKPDTKQIPNDDPTAPKMHYKTIRLGVKNPDGSRGDLVMSTTEVFSFGVSENTAMGTADVNGYTLPLCLHNKDGATDVEKAFTDTFDQIIAGCKTHVLKVKDDIEKYDLEEVELKKMNPLYYKRDRGRIVPGTGPTLYAKLLFKKGKGGGGKIITEFTNSITDQPIDPMTLQKKYCYVTGAIKFESIYIGQRISVQIKLIEALVRPLDEGPKKLLRPSAKAAVTATTSVSDALQGDDDDDDDADGEGGSESEDSSKGSLDVSDGEEAAIAVPTPPTTTSPEKKPVRRVVRKKAAN